MASPPGEETVFSAWQVEVTVDDLPIRAATPAGEARMQAAATQLLGEHGAIYHPLAVSRWFEVRRDGWGQVSLHCPRQRETTLLTMGHSACFLKEARWAMLAVYTAGEDLARAATMANGAGQPLDAYIFDLIGLAVLTKTGLRLNQLAEQQAGQFGWGAGPVLSPGSVHGWALEEQEQLCRLLDIARIGVGLDVNCILKPYKSVSALIGIGPGYATTTVGSACSVCGRRGQCDLRTV